MKARDTKLILSKFWIHFILALVLLWPFFLSAQESVTLNTPDPGCTTVSVAFVNLTWTSTITGNPTYYILRKIQGEANFTEIGSTENTYYIDQPVDSDKNYVYKIRAVRGTDVFLSEEELVSAQYCQSVLLSSQTSCQPDGPRISLSWSSVSGNLLKYEVYRDDVKIGETTNTIFDDGPNIEGTKNYNYFVKAIWQDGNSKNSDTASKKALACPPILAVATECLNISPGGPKVNLVWNSLLGVQEYQIYRKAQNETDFSLLESSLTQTSYIDNLVESLSTYWQGGQISYRIKAIWSTTEKDSIPQQINIPGCSPFLTIESNCDEFSFRLSWTATMNASHYNIYRNDEYLKQIIGTTNTSDTDGLNSLICPDEICDCTYYVKAFVSGLELSSNSVEKSIDCATIIPPSPAPVLDAPEAFCSAGGSQISLSWSPSNNVNYYSVFRNGPEIWKLRETSYIDPGIQSGIGYTYWISAVNSGGSVTSDSRTITAVDCTPPSTSTLTLNKGCTNGQPYVDLSWTETTNTESYEIWRGPSSSNLSLLIIFNKTSPEFTSRTWKDTNVSVSTTYYYKIVSKGPPGVPSSQSNVLSIITFSCLPTTPSVTVIPACLGNNSVVNLSWVTDGVNTFRYEIFRQDYLGGTSPIMTIFNVAIKNWSDTAVSPQTSYIYKVEAVGYLDSQRSTQGWKPAITTYNCFAPGSFSLNEPNLYCQGSYPRADLSWTSSSNATSYDLNRLLNQSSTFLNVNSPYTDWGFGNALSFDGGDFVNLGNPSIPLTGNLTIEFWAKPINITYGRQNPLCKYYANEFCLTMETNGSLNYYHGNDSSYMLFSTANVFTNNIWVHVVLTRDLATRTMRSYKNGVFITSTTWSSTYNPIATANYALRIGRGYVSDFRGIIDDVRLYNRVLSASEIQEHYQVVYNNESNLIGLWRFDEGSGQTVSDSSNFGNNGTLGGTSAVASDDPSWVQNGLQSQTKYSWQAKANGSGGSTYSNTTSPNTMPLCQPTKPSLILNSFCNAGNNLPNVTLKWSYTTATVKYEIWRDGILIKTINQGDSEFSSRTWTDTNDGAGLNQNTAYIYYIKAIGSTGLITQSDSISVITPSCAGPSQPQNLTAAFACSGTNNSYPRVNLSWSASANTTSYTIYRSPSVSPFPVSTILTSYSDTAVIVNTNYSYYVVAYGPGGASPPSNSVPVTTGYCTPSVPSITSLTTTCESNNPANNISWSDSTTFNTFSYEIYRNTSATIPSISIKTIASTSWKDNSGLSALTTYYYWVKAIGPAGQSTSSSRSIATYSCGIIPSTPSLSSNLFCQDNLPYITLSWPASANAYSYNLYRTNPDASQSVYSTRISAFIDKGSSALSFDGVDDYARSAAPLTLTDFSIELWMKPGAKTSGWRTMIGGVSGWEFNLNSGNYFLNAYSQGQLTSTFQLTVGQWYHVVLTRNNSGTSLYINGAFNRSNTNINTISNTTFQIGRWATSQYYQGLIDDVRIYGRYLSASEITDHYNGVYKNEINLKAVWHLDEGTGTTAGDQSGNNNTGTLYNGPIWQTDSPNVLKVLPLERSKGYKYKVKALGADTEGLSNEVSFTTPSCLPAKPDLAITSQCDGTNPQLKLSWSADPNTLYWNIYKGREEEAPKFITDTTQTSYIDDDVESGIEYKYYLTAAGKNIPSVSSDAITETADPCYLEPSEPVISVEPKCYGYSSRILLEWATDATGNTISYNIWRKNITAGETDFTKIYSALSASTTQYLDILDIVTEDNTFIYKVEAVGSGTENTKFSKPSEEVTSYECSSRPPFPEPKLKREGVHSVDHLIAVFISWTGAGNAKGYKVLRSGSDPIEIAATSADIFDYVNGQTGDLYPVTDGKSYEYQVMAWNDNGDTFSNEIVVSVPVARPGEFKLFWRWTTEEEGEGRIRLTWEEAKTSEAGGLVTYEVQQDATKDFTSAIIYDKISLLEWDDNNPTFSERYYRVKATNNALEPTYSNPIKIGLPLPIWKETVLW